MKNLEPLKVIKQLIRQTPLIVDPDHDAVSFQTALAALSTPKLQAFYEDLTSEDRRRFHYVANVCLGFESWSRLYEELVVQETQARLSGRMEEAYAHRTQELRRREEELQTAQGGLEEEVMRLDRQNLSLHRENQGLRDDLRQPAAEPGGLATPAAAAPGPGGPLQANPQRGQRFYVTRRCQAIFR